MEEELPQQMLDSIGDLPEPIYDPEAGPAAVMLLLAPHRFGLHPLAVTGIYLAELILMAGLVWWGWRWWRNRVPPVVREDLPPPRLEAMDRLSVIRENLGEDIGDVAGWLSAALKRFASREYEVNLASQTTEEFHAAVQAAGDALPQGLVQPLAAFFDRCDALKFQPAVDSGAAKSQLWEEAKQIVAHAPLPLQKENEEVGP